MRRDDGQRCDVRVRRDGGQRCDVGDRRDDGASKVLDEGSQR